MKRLKLHWQLKRSGVPIEVSSLSDWVIYNDIFVEGEYDLAIQTALALPRNGQCLNILDVGANVGFFALRTTHLLLANPVPVTDFHITCIEGSPSVYQELRQRLAPCPLADKNLQMVHGLAGLRHGTAKILELSFHPMNSVSNQNSKGASVGYVDLETLLAPGQPVHLLKCDIEGSELSLIENYPGLLQRTHCAIFEFHHNRCDTASCIRQLQQLGFVHRQVLITAELTSLEFFAKASTVT